MPEVTDNAGESAARLEHGFESRWGHQPDFSGSFFARILIPPCRDQNSCFGALVVEHADYLLELVLCQSRVQRRRLNVGVTQVLLHDP